MVFRPTLLACCGLVTLQAVEPAVVAPPAPMPTPAVAPTPAQGQAAAVPRATLPPTSRVVLHLAQHQRASLRWEDSPFPLLLKTPWGTNLIREAAKRPSLYVLLTQLALAEQATVGIEVLGQQPEGHVLATVSDSTLAEALTERKAVVTVDGNAPQAALRATLGMQAYRLDEAFRQGGPGPNMRWSWDDLLPLPAKELQAPIARGVDAELCWSQRAAWAPGGAIFRVTWTLEPFGLRERVRVSGCPAVAASSGPKVYADRAVFAGLPGSTIWAVTCGSVPTLVANFPLAESACSQWATGLGLGPWSELAPRLGSVLLRVEQGAPLPSLTVEISMPQETGATFLALLDEHQQFSADPDGTHVGVLGFVPVQAGWRDGRLVLTTLAGGVTAAITRPGGFLAQPGVTDALKELPTGELLFAGLSRSDESWAALTGLAPWLVRRKPELATLSNDLRKVGIYGFIALHRDQDALVIDAGGLCGGPVSASALITGFLRTSFPRDGERRPRPAKPAAPAPSNENPKQIEF